MSQAAEVDSRSVHQLVNNVLAHKHDEALRLWDSASLQLLEIAQTISDAGEEHQEKVVALRQQYADLIKLRHDMQLHKLAMIAQVGQAYQASLESTDFKEVLSKAVEQEQQAHPLMVDKTSEMKKFDQDTNHVAAPAGNQDDDEDLVMEQNTVLMNQHCPYTKNPVLELDEPVEDSHGYIYEKKAIMAQFRGSSHINCPMAGTTHTVSKQELKPSKSVQREKRRRLMGTQAAGASNKDDDVFDVDNL